MASIEKRGRGWRVRVRVKGHPVETRTLRTRAEAVRWAVERESELRRGQTTLRVPKSLLDALERFAAEVSPKRRGTRWEQLRLAAYAREMPFVGQQIGDVTPDDFGRYRDARLAAGIKGATIRRDFALLSAVFEKARREWQWVEKNPLKDVTQPPTSRPRNRVMTDDERDRIVLALGYEGGKPQTNKQIVALALLFALETGMRSSEILGLTRASIVGPVAELARTKNGDARRVPLSSRALAILDLLPTEGRLFPVSAAVRDEYFRRARDKAGIVGVTFHDARATALTRMAKLPGMDVMRLSKISGHRDVKMLTAVYFRETAESLASLLG